MTSELTLDTTAGSDADRPRASWPRSIRTTADTANIALVHERFTEFAGSEQVVAQLAQMWPSATVSTPVVDPSVLPAELRGRVTGTALSRMLRPGGGYAHLLPALPVAMRHLDLGRPDVVVASHHAFADQIVHATSAPVVAYVHSPARWVWDPQMRAGEIGGRIGGAGLAAFAAAYRSRDRAAARQLTTVLANSHAVAARIREWWGRDAAVVHPPVDTEWYTPSTSVPREDFFLLAGRLVPYKQPALAVRAARKAGVRLVVAGDGRSRAECEALAGPGTEFVGRVSDSELRSLFRRASAVLMPGVEDFGIVPVEAQACGTPVLATGAGGALDSVIPGRTGQLVEAGDDGLLDRWAAALAGFEPSQYDPAVIRRHAEGFSREVFRQRMDEQVTAVLGGSRTTVGHAA